MKSCYNLKVNFIESLAHIVEKGTGLTTSGVWVNKELAEHIHTDKWKEQVAYSIGDEQGALSLTVDDGGVNGDGICLAVVSPWSAPTNKEGEHLSVLVTLPLSDEAAGILAEVLQSALRLRKVQKEHGED
jgi:hypothetical protein